MLWVKLQCGRENELHIRYQCTVQSYQIFCVKLINYTPKYKHTFIIQNTLYSNYACSLPMLQGKAQYSQNKRKSVNMIKDCHLYTIILYNCMTIMHKRLFAGLRLPWYITWYCVGSYQPAHKTVYENCTFVLTFCGNVF